MKPEQRFALQKAFLRQIRLGFPRGFYHLGREKLPWSTGTTEQQLFHRPRIFHVAAPMNRYIVPWHLDIQSSGLSVFHILSISFHIFPFFLPRLLPQRYNGQLFLGNQHQGYVGPAHVEVVQRMESGSLLVASTYSRADARSHRSHQRSYGFPPLGQLHHAANFSHA